MKKSTEKNAQINNARNITQKNEKCDDYCKNQNIILKKKILLIYQFSRFRKSKNVFSIIMHRYESNKNLS